ncbi:tetratricopeptide repeat protein, partial [bacterium]|nr:tetratricopeptide repeat protein [bacterium]
MKAKALSAKFLAPQQLVNEGNKLLQEGKPESILAARAKFIEAVESSRSFYKELDDKSLSDLLTDDIRVDWKARTQWNVVNALGGICNSHFVLKEWNEAIEHFKLAVAAADETLANTEIHRSQHFPFIAIHLKMSEASCLNSIGSILTVHLNNPREALDYNQRAITLFREIQSDEQIGATARKLEALALSHMGQAYNRLDERQNALEYFNQSLAIYQTFPDQQSQEYLLLLEIGTLYASFLDQEKALKNWNDALKIAETLGDKAAQANVLGLIGSRYTLWNNEEEARKNYQRCLELLLSPDYFESNKVIYIALSSMTKEFRESHRLAQLGLVYRSLKEPENALEYFKKALSFARSAILCAAWIETFHQAHRQAILFGV